MRADTPIYSLREILKTCDERGMVRPFVVVLASKNGAIKAVRIGTGEPDVLIEHYEHGGFISPITAMILDQQNTAARFEIDFREESLH